MTPGDVARVLSKCAAFDARTIGQGDIAAWYEVIGHLDVDSCLAAVTLHYRENSHRVMPSEIRKLATDIRARERAAWERRQRALGAAAVNSTKTGRAICTYVLSRLRDAGQDPANGRFLGKGRAADLAEHAVTEWLAMDDGQRHSWLENYARVGSNGAAKARAAIRKGTP